jgi:hypothetical protein
MVKTMTRTLLIDDLRGFRDDRPATIMRTSAAALEFYAENPDAEFDEIWLDHDLGLFPDTKQDDTIMRVVDYFCERAFVDDNPVKVGLFYIHTSNPRRDAMKMSLERFGYPTKTVDAMGYLRRVIWNDDEDEQNS